MDRVVVGLSGGVDSSVAAAVLHDRGFEVVGVTLWLMKGKGQCCSEGMVDAASICEQLGISHHIVDTRGRFQENIVDYLVLGYEAGITPLPCSQCNRAVKFAPMLDYARSEFGIDRIATGHYARLRYDATSDRHQLLRAVDRNKDQSYFLYDLSQDILAATLFPLGEQTKDETRRIAERFRLSTAAKPDSQDLCLVEAHGSMQAFLDRYIAPKAGEIVDLDGRVLGTHQGVHHYTIGQRKGLGVAAAEPLYVVKLDPVMNRVVVGNRESAGSDRAAVARVNWVSISPPTAPFTAEVQVRYRSSPVPAQILPLEGDLVQLRFADSQFGITPGQAAVFYRGELLLGGGILEKNATD